MYHLVQKTDTSGVVAGGSVYDRSKLAPQISSPYQGIFNDSFGVELSITRDGDSTALVRPASLLEHACMHGAPMAIARTLAKECWSQLLRGAFPILTMTAIVDAVVTCLLDITRGSIEIC